MSLIDREEAERGIQIIRDAIHEARELGRRNPAAEPQLLCTHVRDQVAHILACLIAGHYPAAGEWPGPLMIALTIPAMRPAYASLIEMHANLSQAYKLIDSFDSAIGDARKWPAFFRRLADFELRLPLVSSDHVSKKSKENQK